MSVSLSDRTAATILRLLEAKGNVAAPWDNAGYSELARRGHASAAALYDHRGRLMKSKLHQITPAGRAWLAGRG